MAKALPAGPTWHMTTLLPLSDPAESAFPQIQLSLKSKGKSCRLSAHVLTDGPGYVGASGIHINVKSSRRRPEATVSRQHLVASDGRAKALPPERVHGSLYSMPFLTPVEKRGC